MRIKNRTVLSKSLLMRFSFSNLFHKLRFNLVIFPFIIVVCVLAVQNATGEKSWMTPWMIMIAVIVPVLILAISFILAQRQIKNYSQLNQTIETEFDEKGIYISPNGKQVLISFDYIKECVEYPTMFAFYFKGAAPIVVAKEGFKFGNYKPFKEDMKKYIGNKCKFKK